jgi:hypothetical protein
VVIEVKFPLGRTVATPAALDAIKEAGQEPAEFLRRHQAGDWGDLCQEDRQEKIAEVGALLLTFLRRDREPELLSGCTY